MIKEYTGYYYDVVAYKGHHGLSVVHTDSFDNIVEQINDIVEGAKLRGYNNNEQWLIVTVEYGRTWDDDIFISSWEKRNAVALYDNGVVTDL